MKGVGCLVAVVGIAITIIGVVVTLSSNSSRDDRCSPMQSALERLNEVQRVAVDRDTAPPPGTDQRLFDASRSLRDAAQGVADPNARHQAEVAAQRSEELANLMRAGEPHPEFEMLAAVTALSDTADVCIAPPAPYTPPG